jgi:hypothetical protein
MSGQAKTGQPSAPKSVSAPKTVKSGQGVWEVWGLGPFPIRTKNLRKTLQKILLKHEGNIAIHRSPDFYYYYLDGEAVQNLLNGQTANVVATLEPPCFKGCKAYMYVTLYPKLFEV